MTNFTPSKATIIVMTNQAGGVWKSETAVNVASFLAEKYPNQVCLIDADGQQTATMKVGINPYELKASLYEGLLHPNEFPFDNIVQSTPFKLDLIPASEDLYSLDLDLIGVYNREGRLKKFLRPALNRYQYIIIDAPPSLGMLQVNALNAANVVFIVSQANAKSFNGLNMLLKTLREVRKEMNPQLKVGGVIVSFYEKHTQTNRHLLEKIQNYPDPEISQHILAHYIRKNITLAAAGNQHTLEAETHITILGSPINHYDSKKSSNGYNDYQKLTKVLEKRLKSLFPI